jgi:hypothetical protein
LIIKVLGEYFVSVMDKVLMPAFLPDDRPQLLQRPVCTRVRGHIHVRQTACAVLDDNEYVQHPERRRTATKKSHARIAFAWFFRKVDQR